METGEPRRKCQRMTTSPALLSLSGMDEGELRVTGTKDTVSEDASIANMVEPAVSVCWQVDWLKGALVGDPQGTRNT